jgi:radical SAM superfamily enzyme YgiQ (UPF0313 family)
VNARFPYHAQLRPNYVNEERIAFLKESGCVSITMAPEVGSEKIRKQVLRKGVPDRAIFKAAELLHKHKIPFRTENMLGIPATSWQDDLATLAMNVKLDPECAWASIYTPYVGTPLAEVAIQAGEYDRKQLDDIPASFFEHTVLKLPFWSRLRINNLQKLFGIAVDLAGSPWLSWLSYLMIRVGTLLPLGFLYKRWYKSWKEKSYRRNLFKAAYGNS